MLWQRYDSTVSSVSVKNLSFFSHVSTSQVEYLPLLHLPLLVLSNYMIFNGFI